MIDFHHQALAQFEARQRREEQEQPTDSFMTWHIETSVWEQTCFSHDEVKEPVSYTHLTLPTIYSV